MFTTGFNFVANTLARASQVNQNFLWFRGSFIPITQSNTWAKVNSIYDLGSSAFHWANAYIDNLPSCTTIFTTNLTATNITVTDLTATTINVTDSLTAAKIEVTATLTADNITVTDSITTSKLTVTDSLTAAKIEVTATLTADNITVVSSITASKATITNSLTSGDIGATNITLSQANGGRINTLYKDNIIKGWNSWDQETLTIFDGFNVSGLSDVGAGVYTINWDDDFSDDNYCPVGTLRSTTGVSLIAVTTLTAALVTLRTVNDGVTEDVISYVMAIGDQ